jgi:uncharacterized membrane protein (DUF4010 family)
MPDFPTPPLLEIAQRLAIAGLIGLAVGTEREWSSPEAPTERRFAGIRTFFLIALLGGVAGILVAVGALPVAVILLASGSLFIVTAYAFAIRRPEQRLDGTTEMAALVVLALAALAGLGYLALAGGCGALVALALAEKHRLHGWVRKIDQAELRAGIQFLVLALVILPLLPTGPYPGLWDLRPRELWGIVLLLSGINFASHIARQFLGAGRGYAGTGVFGGIISSTAVTFQFSRLSREEGKDGHGLALGVIGACTIVPIRVMVIAAATDLEVARLVLPYMALPLVVGLLLFVAGLRYPPGNDSPLEAGKSPLGLISALQMTAFFQGAMIALGYVQRIVGDGGFIPSAILLGLADADALAYSMSQLPEHGTLALLAAKGIGFGIAASTANKLLISMVIGTGSFRRWAAPALALMLLSQVIGIWWMW